MAIIIGAAAVDRLSSVAFSDGRAYLPMRLAKGLFGMQRLRSNEQ
ncbi:hypothetical protein ES703_06384 [subsurface metagenome]